MTSFANELAAQMNNIMESSEHKSIFRSAPIGKFASKKDDDKEDDKDKKKDSKNKDKKDDKDEKKEEKKGKKASINALIEIIARSSAALDDFGLVKSSLATIKALEVISSEIKEKEDKDDDKEDDKKEDKKDDDKKDDKSKSDDSSYSDDFSIFSTDQKPVYDQKETEDDVKRLDELSKSLTDVVKEKDNNSALDAEKMFEDIPSMGEESSPVDIDAPSVPEVDSDELVAMLEAVGIKLTPEQEGKLFEMIEGGKKAEAMKIVGKLLASKFGA